MAEQREHTLRQLHEDALVGVVAVVTLSALSIGGYLLVTDDMPKGLRPRAAVGAAAPNSYVELSPMPMPEDTIVTVTETEPADTTVPTTVEAYTSYDIAATLPVPNPDDGAYNSVSMAFYEEGGAEIVTWSAKESYGVDASVECVVGGEVQIKEGEGVWQTLATAAGVTLKDNMYLNDDEYRVIHAAVDLNINRGYIESEQDIVHPGDALLSVTGCVETLFIYDDPERENLWRIAQFPMGSQHETTYYWVRDDDTGEMRAAEDRYDLYAS